MTKLTEAIFLSLGINSRQLDRLIQKSPFSYKVYQIPKRTGGARTIAQPARETKFVQQWLIENVFRLLPVHVNATAYQKGAGIKKNAELHKDKRYLSKFDFKDFFYSLKKSDIEAHLSLHLKDFYSTNDYRRIAEISCIRYSSDAEMCLSIGAPSSPILSNTLMYDLDCKLMDWCIRQEVSYSRYADDLTFSTNKKNMSDDIELFLRELVDSLEYPKLLINDKKTVHLSKKFQRRITGVVINNNGELSIGRDRKREISTLVHRYKIGLLSKDDAYRLQGLIGFVHDIEPHFLQTLNSKYGDFVISEITQLRKKSI